EPVGFGGAGRVSGGGGVELERDCLVRALPRPHRPHADLVLEELGRIVHQRRGEAVGAELDPALAGELARISLHRTGPRYERERLLRVGHPSAGKRQHRDQDQISQSCTASLSPDAASRVGMNSCATQPSKPVSAMARMMAGYCSSWSAPSSWRPGLPAV